MATVVLSVIPFIMKTPMHSEKCALSTILPYSFVQIFPLESDEFEDVLPPPAPVLSFRRFPNPSERKVSLGLLELVGRSSALAVCIYISYDSTLLFFRSVSTCKLFKKK